LFAQYIGIAFAGLGEGNDLIGNGLFDAIVAVPGPQSNTSHFEGNT